MSTDFYPKSNAGQGVNRLWNTTSVNKIDLRAELSTILHGDRSFIKQGHWVVIRHMERVCPCTLEEAGQKHHDPDPLCSICRGEGYLFTDYPCIAWRALIDAESGALPATFQQHVVGLVNINAVNFFMEWNVNINLIDKIFEIELDPSGKKPDRLEADLYIEKYNIDQLIPYRGDNGRIEYKRAVCTRAQW